MNIVFRTRQNGAVILEALIAFLVLGVGVLALLYLQGNLTGGSSLSKARAEAMELAKDRTEMLRDYIHRDQFISALNAAQDDIPVTGKNAIYAVSYELDNAAIDSVTNPPRPDDAQLLTVTVSWEGPEEDLGGDPKVEKVTLETQLFFTDPVILSSLGSANSGDDAGPPPLPSPWITGWEGTHPSTKKFSGSDDPTEDVLLKDGDVPLISVQIKNYYLTVDGTEDGSRVSSGNVEVLAFVDTDGDDIPDTWEVVLTSFGGIVHKLQGDIIIAPEANTTLGILADDLRILASPPSYCVFPICDGNDCTDKERARYVCYVPGDCTYQDEYVTSGGGALNGCPADFIPPTDDFFHDLNGGWYGRVGNFGVAIHPDDKVCTFETDIDAPKTSLTPSRSYDTYRCAVALVDDECPIGSIIGNEGINTPYSNQTFLITRKNSNCYTEAEDLGVQLVSTQIERTPLIGEKKFNVLGAPDDTDGVWNRNVVLTENDCTPPDTGDGSCP